MDGVNRWVLAAMIGLAGALVAGCGQQQLEERNVALTKQLEQTLQQNADLQAQNETLKEQNLAFSTELEKARARLSGQGPEKGPVKVQRPKPEFGEGVETAMVGESLHVTLPETVLFASGKADLKGESKKVLDHVASVLNKDYAAHKIRVEGHTDTQPISKSRKYWQDNLDLSCNRAMAVVRYLNVKGVDPKRTYAAGWGPYKPIATNDSAAGRAKNRRVVIVVSPQ